MLRSHCAPWHAAVIAPSLRVRSCRESTAYVATVEEKKRNSVCFSTGYITLFASLPFFVFVCLFVCAVRTWQRKTLYVINRQSPLMHTMTKRQVIRHQMNRRYCYNFFFFKLFINNLKKKIVYCFSLSHTHIHTHTHTAHFDSCCCCSCVFHHYRSRSLSLLLVIAPMLVWFPHCKLTLWFFMSC